MTSRVLLTGPAFSSASAIDAIRSFDRDTDFIPDVLTPEVLDRIALGEFDGVVCEADGTGALDLVSRIRNSNAGVPVVLVSTRPDSEFESRAIAVGASSVIAGTLHSDVVAETLALTLKVKLAARDLEERGKTNEKLRRELQAALLESQVISQYGGHVNRHWQRRGLLPLLVENDPDAAFLFLRAFEKAEVFAPLPIVRSPQEALAYLQGSPPFENRNLHPLPNSIMIDLSPPTGGDELVRWIRQQPHLQGIPIIVLSETSTPEEVRACYANLANSFLVKPAEFDELVSLIKTIEVYWTRMNLGRAF